MRSLHILSCALLCLVEAQVQVKGRFQETVLALQKSATSQPNLYMPAQKVNNLKLLTEELFNEAMVTKPYKFAESVALKVDVNHDGQWVDTRALDGTPIKIWRAIVASDDALSLSLQFDEFHLPDGAEFYLIGRETFMGAFTARVNNKAENNFATVPMPGDFVGLELVVPVDKNAEKMNKMLKEELKIKIGKIAHGFRNFPKSFNDSGSCNIDVACRSDSQYEAQIKSVAMIITRDGTRFCTGTMINNTKLNRRQLFLTANHCLFTSAYNFVAVFNYQKSTCGGSGPEPSLIQSAHGMKLLATYAPSDFALLEIIETIPDSYNAYLAGWDISSVAPSNVFGVHHPSGDVKKICFFNDTCLPSSWTEQPRKLHWMVPQWTEGTTEPGSSGSALFNSKGLIVGHLHGGQASCNNPTGYDMYGGLVHDWTGGGVATRRLRDHLNPTGNMVTALGGMWLRRSKMGDIGKAEDGINVEEGIIDDIREAFDNLIENIHDRIAPWFSHPGAVAAAPVEEEHVVTIIEESYSTDATLEIVPPEAVRDPNAKSRFVTKH